MKTFLLLVLVLSRSRLLSLVLLKLDELFPLLELKQLELSLLLVVIGGVNGEQDFRST